jgi:hypothetical protein
MRTEEHKEAQKMQRWQEMKLQREVEHSWPYKSNWQKTEEYTISKTNNYQELSATHTCTKKV